MTALLLGFATAFTLAIVPGPLGIFILIESATGRRGRAAAAAAGGTVVDTTVCFLVFAGLGAALAPATQSTPGRAFAVAATAVLGAAFLLLPARKEGPPPGNLSGFLLGMLICSLNAGTLGPWLVASAAVQGRGILEPGIAPGALFAAGAAFGTLAWFCVLIFGGSLFNRHRDRFAACARRVVAGVLFVVSAWLAATI